MLTVYRILTYLLLPFAAILGLLTLFTLLASFSNIAGLLPAFLCGATVIYLVVSFNFLHKSLIGRNPSKPSRYDWIKVNGFVALFFAALFIFQGIYFRENKELNEQLKIQMEAMREQIPDSGPFPDPDKIIRWVLNFMVVSGTVLLAHVLITFSFLKKYGGYFRKETDQL